MSEAQGKIARRYREIYILSSRTPDVATPNLREHMLVATTDFDLACKWKDASTPECVRSYHEVLIQDPLPDWILDILWNRGGVDESPPTSIIDVDTDTPS